MLKQGKLKLSYSPCGKLMRRLSTQDQNFKQVFADLLAFETVNDPELLKTVDQIIADVRQHGDDHVLKLTQQFDRHPAHQFSDLELTQEQLKLHLRV
jgi:histidinol dehydrogenase